MILEVCTDSLEGVLAAEKYKANRVELCTALSVGGVSPDYGLIAQCVKNSTINIQVLVRPREGDFNYSNSFIKSMVLFIETVTNLGVKGVVFGILNSDLTVSKSNKYLVDLAHSFKMEAVFHRAFDFVSDYNKAIENIIDFGFDRVLTSGLKSSAEHGINVLKDLEKNYGEQIQIMAGGGINPKNAKLFESNGIKNLHFSAHNSTNFNLAMGLNYTVDEQKIKEMVNLFQ
jgi:copper homeostasis protein